MSGSIAQVEGRTIEFGSSLCHPLLSQFHTYPHLLQTQKSFLTTFSAGTPLHHPASAETQLSTDSEVL